MVGADRSLRHVRRHSPLKKTPHGLPDCAIGTGITGTARGAGVEEGAGEELTV